MALSDLIPSPQRWMIDAVVIAGALAAIWGYGAYQHHEGFKDGAKSVRDEWNAEKLATTSALATKNADTAVKNAQASTNQTQVLNVLQTTQVSIASGADAAASAAIGRLRILANRSPAGACAVPQGARASSPSDAGQTTVAAQLRDADRSDLVAVGAAADKVIAERQALLTACRGLLHEAWRMTN